MWVSAPTQVGSSRHETSNLSTVWRVSLGAHNHLADCVGRGGNTMRRLLNAVWNAWGYVRYFWWTYVRGGRWVVLAAVALLVPLVGCASPEAFKAWQKVETSRATAWENVHVEKAKHPPVSRVTLKPPPGEKTVSFNGTLIVEIAHPGGQSTAQLPPVSKRPATSGEVAARMFQNPLGKVVRGLLGWKGMEEGADVLKEGFKAKGVKVQAGDGANIGIDRSTVDGSAKTLDLTGDQNQAGIGRDNWTLTNQPRRDTDNPVTN